MNGAVSLLGTMAANGVTTCFMNPGTSEMHFVAALDDVPEVRGVLCLFEGVASGAADGYARVTGRPAATLLHLGPGLGNAFANLHNARRAHSAVLNIVGDHATYHSRYDAPLDTDIASVAAALDGWFRRTSRSDDLAADAVAAIRASVGPPGRVATLVLPADVSWTERTTDTPMPLVAWPQPAQVADDVVADVAAALRGRRGALLLGGPALRRRGLDAAARVAASTGCRVLHETFPAVMDRGASVFAPERLNYLAEFAIAQLEGVEVLVLAGATSPVSFFAYPNLPSDLVPAGCEVTELASLSVDVPAALEALAESLGAAPRAPVAPTERPSRPTGALDTRSLAEAVGALLPEGCIVVDESNTSGVGMLPATAGAPEHEWLTLTGGAIGYALPAAVGAAIGGGGRRVVCLESDGSMCYTPQALWTMAREGLDVTVLCCSNRRYAILNYELSRVGATERGDRARRMLDLTEPTLDLAATARSFGVPAETAATADELVGALEKSLATPGPTFIEATLASIFD
ncbi:MAG TPA: acetolactate synthase large subunit [Acidimicrobiales bacterium]